MRNKKTALMAAIILLLSVAYLATPKTSLAVHGEHISNTPIRVYAKQGGGWFLALTKRTDDRGVLKVKNALPGEYKMEVSSSDTKDDQTLGVELQMLDAQGRRIHSNMDADLYVYIGNDKYLVSSLKTSSGGWLKVSGLSPGTKYYIDIDSGQHINSKYGEMRIKTDAQIDGSDWFQASYKRTKSNVLNIGNILPGKYRFKAVSKPDGSIFALKGKVLDGNGQKAYNSEVDIYAYLNGSKTLVGKAMADGNASLELPKVMVGMDYRLEVK